MTKPLEFRVWDKATEAMRKVYAIDLKNCYVRTPIGATLTKWSELDNIVLMQYTGLKDKNGKKIFEGDIIKPVGFASWIGVVRYSADAASYIISDHDNDFLREAEVFLSQFADGLEVLGNIFEDAELIKGRIV